VVLLLEERPGADIAALRKVMGSTGSHGARKTNRAYAISSKPTKSQRVHYHTIHLSYQNSPEFVNHATLSP